MDELKTKKHEARPPTLPKLEKIDSLQIPAMIMPSFRAQLAIQNGVHKNLLIKTWGGLGDQICAEPTLRYALKYFKDSQISLHSETPELFTHLKFKEVFDGKKVNVHEDQYYVFETIRNLEDIQWQFMSHMVTNCVDYPSLCAFRFQLPIEDRIVNLPTPLDVGHDMIVPQNSVVLHPGRHWQSKTFPKWWWDKVIELLTDSGITPILIGANTDDNRGTVDVDASKCLDLRNELTITQSILLLKNSRVLFTNDSSPLHMAVDSQCHIGFVATCKHPDYIMHWRRDNEGKPSWAWRMQNLGKGGIWDLVHICPNNEDQINGEDVGDWLLKWLPEPSEVFEWIRSKLD